MVYSEMQRVGIYLLVMLAASLLIYMCIRFIQSFSVERAEKGARSRLVSPSAVGVYRFIDKIRLRQLQTSIGILAAGLFVGTLLFCGVYNPLAVIVGGVVFFAGLGLRGFIFPERRRRGRRSLRPEFSIWRWGLRVRCVPGRRFRRRSKRFRGGAKGL